MNVKIQNSNKEKGGRRKNVEIREEEKAKEKKKPPWIIEMPLCET